jgi:uncharacterized protein YcfJ
MKVLFAIVSALLLSGCYATTVYTPTSVAHEVYPRVIYSEYSPPVTIYQPVCYMRAVPIYGTRQVIDQPYGGNVITGSAIGAIVGHELADNKNKELGLVVGAIIGGSIANTPRVRTERVVIGSGQQRVCN